MNNTKLNKIKAQTPVSLIVHGGNRDGYLIAKTLIDQGAYVIIVDEYNGETKKYISDLKNTGKADFFDFKGYESLLNKLKKFDYLFYLLNNKLNTTEFNSKEFLSETQNLEISLQASKRNSAKFSLVTSLFLNRELSIRVNNEKISNPSPYSNIELQKYCETLAAEFKDKTSCNIRIIRLATVIGLGVENLSNKVLHNLLLDATQKSQITIHGEGLDNHNLIHENDSTYGILKLTFSEKTNGEVITLANKNDYTTLSLAYKLLELNTDAQSIKFVEDKESEFLIRDLYVPATHATKYGWTQQTSLEEALIEEIQVYYDKVNKKWEITDKKTKPKEKSITNRSETTFGSIINAIIKPIKNLFDKENRKEIEPKKILKFSAFALSIFLFVYFIIYPVIGLLLGATIISKTISDTKESITELDISKSKKNIEKINNNLERVSSSLENLYWIFNITNNKELYNNSSQILLGFQYTLDGADSLVNGLEPFAMYVKDFQPAINLQSSTPTTTREYRQYLSSIEDNQYMIDDASYKISLATELVNSVNTSIFPSFLQDPILEAKDILKEVEKTTKSAKEALIFVPKLLGVDERQRYLILLQNESEIRSTGGWLTSYGILGIEGGQVRELFVDDIYNADGTLKVQGKSYTPPKSMQTALDIKSWPFSLVNWNPDLSETQIAAEPFIKDLGKGNDLDGVITIDIAFIQKVLDYWGGIEVPGENEIITSDNLYAKVFEMHENFTPGSTQKTTFLANLSNEIIKKLLSLNISDLALMGNVFTDSFNEKHLQVTFSDRDAYKYFNDKSWAGTIDSRYNEAPVVVDWNWGGNKANLYLEKNHSLTLDIKDENTIDVKYILTVENNSTENKYPQGDYINYQRIYIPSNANILKIDGLKDNAYTTYKENGFKVIGGWFNTEIQKINTLEISYRLTRESASNIFPLLKDNSNIFFDINIFKQAGEKKNAYKLDVLYPSTWNLESSEYLNSISNQLSGRFDLDTDKTFSIVWRIAN